ncbi:MAG TPA: hypothetical protein VLL76_12440, partial [Candidatus Omnitrophota bacterium]|nr:hypothetical protein [Candidatus Omnitrophota bacterium]
MRVTESERAFLHELHSVKKDPLGKRIIHFFVSLAPQGGDMAKKIDSAKQFIKKAFAKSPYCQVFSAHNGDIFVTYSHITVSEVLASCNRVEKLFCESAVLSARNAYNEYGFYKVADAVKDIDKVFTAFKSIIAQSQPEPDKYTKRPLSPENLSFLCEKLRNADLRACIFNQPVYFIGNKVPSIEFLEFYVSTAQIESVFLPDTNILGNAWLFQALKEEFDRATLRTVAKEIVDYRHKSFSVNVGLSTILGREFADFYEALPSKLAGRIVLEIHKTDLVQNFNLMKDVKQLVEEKGLKLCIDGVDWRDFEILCLDKLKPNYVKVVWHNDLLSTSESELTHFVKAVKAHDACEIVLSRCDNPKAFPFARTLGV